MSDRYEPARREAGRIAEDILAAGRNSRSEADLRSKVSHILLDFAERNGIPLESREEYTIASGLRPDTIYNQLVVEYKAPGTLSNARRHRQTEVAILQIQSYLDSLSGRGGGRPQRMSGIVLDGRFLIFVRVFPTTRQTDPPVEVAAQSIELLLRHLISLSTGAAILPENLLDDFGITRERTKALVGAFYQTLDTTEDPLVRGLFQQWKLYFTEVAGFEVESKQFSQKEGVSQLLKALGLNQRDADPPRLFFALHTYYALLIKLIAWLAVSPFLGRLGTSFGQLAQATLPQLQERLRNLERGGIFRELGIRNFLEGDFFGWYLLVWNDNIASCVHDVAVRLGEYDPGTLSLNPQGTRDLLKQLYQFLMPREVRHDLGEYYTPDWLAQLTLNRLEGSDPYTPFEGDPKKRVLDPACGSGTFLVLAINAVKKTCETQMLSERETLGLILNNVIGMDLNPLAVIAARTNYLLAIQDLIEHRSLDITIPVYLSDSVKIPTESGDVDTFGNILVPTVVATFAVPPSLANRDDMDKMANLIDECIESRTSENAFMSRASNMLVAESFSQGREALASLYRQITDLHRKGLDGVWSRILKNAFAPVFIGDDFDYIVGNPPWINWESLPGEYRTKTTKLWDHYGLFPHEGMDTILGKGKKDISMLMTYAVMDRHLKSGGKLAFVITQTLFKTSGAAQGFRRFRIGQNGPELKALHIDDMTDLNPFEGATNRTAVMVLTKGRPNSWPVPYAIWKRERRGTIPFDTSLREALGSSRMSLVAAAPVDPLDATSAWLTAPANVVDALRKVLGKASYEAHAGVYTGGANGVFWVEILQSLPGGLVLCRNITAGSKRRVGEHEGPLEESLLFPLLRGRDVSRWSARAQARILFVQDPKTRKGIELETMERDFPKAFAWLRHFEGPLRNRAALNRYFSTTDEAGNRLERAPFYSMFNVGRYTLSPWKVLWREVSNEINAVVVGPTRAASVLPDHTLILVPFDNADEAHYFCAIINSSPARILIRNSIVLHPDPHVLERVRIPSFDASDAIHRKLASLSRQAHERRNRDLLANVEEMEREIDDQAALLWGLDQYELSHIRTVLPT